MYGTLAGMPAKFSVEYQGRSVEVVPDSLWERDRVRLLVDGETVVERTANGKQTVLTGDGFEVRAVMPFWGGSVVSAELVPAGGVNPLELEPEAGTRAARRAAFARRHPRLYASRHVISGAFQVAVAILGLTLAFKLLPAIPLPSIDLPRIDLPDIPWPNLNLPSITLPEWVRDVLESKKYWLPIVVGVALAVRETRKRKRRQTTSE